jgi:hypothetical protein
MNHYTRKANEGRSEPPSRKAARRGMPGPRGGTDPIIPVSLRLCGLAAFF